MARTKVDGGAVSRTAGAYNGLRGATLAATATKQNLTAAVGNPPSGKYQCVQVIVQNATGSAGVLYVGDSRYQEFALATGASVTIPVNDLSLVYVRAATTATVNLLISE